MSARAVPFPETKLRAGNLSPEARALIWVVIISLAIVLPALIFGVPSNRDLDNHFRFALPFYDSLRSGHLYPGWLAESNSGYGDPSFRFYPPALYYLLAGARALTGGWYSATLLTFAALSVVAGLGMYYWARSILPASTAMWAGVFYVLAPYHVNQLYQATLLAEYAGSAVLPFAFAFVERVCEKGRSRDIAGLAAVYALLVLTHLPLATIGTLALLAYAALRLQRPDRIKTIMKLAIAIGLGLCASAVYWVTMIAELGWIAINNVERDASADYRLNFLLSTFSPVNLNVWWMNILALMTLLLFAPLVGLLRRRSSDTESAAVKSVAILTLFAIFMAIPLSRPLWKILPPLQQTQFPWRWLALASMGGSILASAALPFWQTQSGTRGRVARTLVFGVAMISIAFTLSHVVREAQYLSPSKFSATLTAVRGSASVNYWFPIWAHSNPRTMQLEVEASGRPVSVSSWTPEHRQFAVAAGAPTEARLRTFYYPHWTATSEGRALPTRPDNDGALLISLPANSVLVNLDFQEPNRSRISGATSFLGFLFIGVLASTTPWRRKR
jgi:hypothetical protein